MSAYPNLINEPEFLKIKTRDDEVRELKYKTELHDNEKILKALKDDIEKDKEKYVKLN